MVKRKWKLSASFIGAFKACPTRCRLGYVIGLRKIEDTDAQRKGTNWHRILEISRMSPGTVCPDCGKGQKNPNCPLCEGTDILPEDMMTAVTRFLNQAYSDRPVYKTEEEWETERIILLYSLVGYNWHWKEDDEEIEVLDQELEFSIPLRNPETSRALPNVTVQGKIDKIIKKNQKTYIMEHKSTTKGIDPDSTYWNRLNLDTQTRLYPHAARTLDPTYSSIQVYYDVWHKPTIKPKMLTQAASKQFVEDGLYCNVKFTLEPDIHGDAGSLGVNGIQVEFEPGKKEGTFAIRETPEMFGARLLQDIIERPEFYFARREVPRTDADLKQFEVELYNIYQTVKAMNKNGGWYTCESQCEATFKCQYIDLCYNNVTLTDDMEYEGFKNIFKEEK